MRTSTLLLMVAFFGVLALWVSVRPTTAETTDEVLVRHTTRTTTEESDESRRRESTPTPTAKPTPSATPTPVVPAVKKGVPGPAAPVQTKAPNAPLPVAPAPSFLPLRSSPSSFGILPPHHNNSTPQPDAAAPGDPNTPPSG